MDSNLRFRDALAPTTARPGVTRLIRAVSGGSSDRPPQLDWYTGTMPVAIL